MTALKLLGAALLLLVLWLAIFIPFVGPIVLLVVLLFAFAWFDDKVKGRG